MSRRLRWFPRRIGRDVRAWPMLALLLLVVLIAGGCVLWFMREAMRNERLAVRQKLADAYRGQLGLAERVALERWDRWLRQLDDPEPGAAHFARCAAEGLADAVICFDAEGSVSYPASTFSGDAPAVGAALQAEVRELMKAGDAQALAAFVLEKFDDEAAARLVDAHGRLISANAELAALEALGRNDERVQKLAERLEARLLDYTSTRIPAAQRRFLMRELQRLWPAAKFPTLPAEDLAARFLETTPKPAREKALRATALPDVWAVASGSRRVLALLTRPSLRARLDELIRDPSLPAQVKIAAIGPGEDPPADSTLVVAALGPELPGWRLGLSLDDRAAFDTAADQRVARYLAIGTFVVASMLVLGVLVAQGFRRQLQLTRLKNDLVATVSHELKTPLTSMRALVDTLLEAERFDEATTREYLQLVAQENARLSRLIDNFLTFSRLERRKFAMAFEPVAPKSIVARAVAAMGERCRAPGCHLEERTAPDLPPIIADGDALTTALLNLLDNAWKYSGEAKQIVVRTDQHGGAVRFAVEDNGPGLAAREHQKIFRRFYQVEEAGTHRAGGCGLGLSIVWAILEAHGGKVGVTSAPGRGSVFTMEIPIAVSG